MAEEQWIEMSDKERWLWLKANQDKGLTVMLDNDATMVWSKEEDAECLYFDDYVGDSAGVLMLLSLLGIKAELV